MQRYILGSGWMTDSEIISALEKHKHLAFLCEIRYPEGAWSRIKDKRTIYQPDVTHIKLSKDRQLVFESK